MKYQTVKYFDKKNQPHRLDGPAVIYSNGFKAWYLNGKYHREDGPARIWAGSKSKYLPDWYLYKKYYGEGIDPPEDYLKELERLGIKFVRGSDVSEDYPE